MVARISLAMDGLVDHAELGRPGRVPGTRELVVTGTPFIIPYRIKDSSVEILRIYHASRRWPDDF
jgi:toxin ParE1/3/4